MAANIVGKTFAVFDSGVYVVMKFVNNNFHLVKRDVITIDSQFNRKIRTETKKIIDLADHWPVTDFPVAVVVQFGSKLWIYRWHHTIINLWI